MEFAIFGPFGKRVARQSKYTEEVWTGQGWVTRQVAGPSHLGRWLKCWEVFKAAMIMCKQVSVQTMDTYANGIKQLMELYPAAWHLVVVADEICRQERWEMLLEVYTKNPPAAGMQNGRGKSSSPTPAGAKKTSTAPGH